MKKIVVAALLLLITNGVFSQAWLENLPKTKTSKDLTLKEYQKAFNDYWAPFNVVKGKYTDAKGNLRKAPGWKQFKRWEWYMETQVDPKTGAFPKTSAMAEFNKVENRDKSLKAGSYQWTNLGTNTTPGGYAGIGRLNCIAFHPSDNNTYWVGAPSGGLWKTTDDGTTWSCQTDGNDVMGVSSIIVVANNSADIDTVYIGTGDRDAFDNNSIGVLKSTDDGLTWTSTALNAELYQSLMVTKMLIDPNNSNRIITFTNTGVFETTDAGDSFTEICPNYYIDSEYKIGDFNRFYCSSKTGKIDTLIYDGAWEYGNAVTIAGGKRTEIAVSPDEPTWIYALLAASDDGLLSVQKSEDEGVSFSEVFSGTTKNLLGWASSGTDEGGQGWYDLSIAVSPTNADTVLVGGVNTWKSVNGGVDWEIANHWSGAGGIQAVHADKHNLVYRSNGDLFELNDGGIYISQTDGDDGSWVDETNGITISQIYKLSVSQTTDNEVIVGLQDNGTKLYTNNEWWDVKGGDGMECLIDYTNDNVQYGTYVNGQITRTMDHWNNDYTDIEPDDDGAWVTPYIIHPDDNKTLYAGYQNVWKTTDRGDSWTKISYTNTNDNIRSMAICEYASSTIYAADPTQLWKTVNGGVNWVSMSNNLPSAGNILSVAVKSDDPNTVWITLSGYQHDGVYQSIDGGATWTSISAGLPQIPIHTIVYNKLEKSAIDLYVGTEVGVYYKSGDADWVYYNDGLPNVMVSELEIYYNKTNPAESKLRAATYGRGLWEAPLVTTETYVPYLTTEAATNVTDSSATINGTIISDYGSPVTESGFVYSLINYPVIDAEGAIKVTTDPLVATGTYSIAIKDLDDAKAYYVRSYAINANGTSYGKAASFITPVATSVEALVKNGIQIFPNPTQGELSIQFDDLKKDMLVIIKDASGKMIKTKKADKKLFTINLNHQAKGIYFVEISWPGERIVSKVLLN